MLLFQCRLDSGTHTLHGRATVKTVLKKKQRHEREACPGFKTRRQPIASGCAGWPLKTLTELLLRATPLKEGMAVVDAVPKAARKPLRTPIRARVSECLMTMRAQKENAFRMCA